MRANVHGVVLLDKPTGISSNRAVQKVRGIFQARKAGHTGSLDPFASGMLPICLGEASKTAAFMLRAGKQYRATALMGQATATGDIEGDIIQTCPVPEINAATLLPVLQKFTGEIEQIPPMYSALKHKGKPLYEYARAGIEIERPARPVTIHALELVHWQAPLLSFDVRCSKGTYIRTLAEDIATALGSCAHLVELRRSFVEPFAEQSMVSLEQLQLARDSGGLLDFLLPADAGLLAWPRVELDGEQQEKFSHGNRFLLSVNGLEFGMLRVYGPEGNLLGLAEYSADGLLQPSRVFQIQA